MSIKYVEIEASAQLSFTVMSVDRTSIYEGKQRESIGNMIYLNLILS